MIDHSRRYYARRVADLPFEFEVIGVPASVQSASWRKRQWRREVAARGRSAWGVTQPPHTGQIQFQMAFFFEGARLDVDNMIKGTQDALNGIVYKDDSQLLRTRADVRDLNKAFRCRGMSEAMARGFMSDQPFVIVRVCSPPDLEELP